MMGQESVWCFSSLNVGWRLFYQPKRMIFFTELSQVFEDMPDAMKVKQAIQIGPDRTWIEIHKFNIAMKKTCINLSW